MDKESAKTPIRLLIVDDHPVVRAGLSSMLRKQKGIQIAGVAASAEEAFAVLAGRTVDVILLDLRMPRMSGIDALHVIAKQPSPPRVLILSSFEFEEEIFRAVKAGARGYLLKDMSRDEIVAAITAVHAGKRYFPPAIAARLAERKLRSTLSAREVEILELLAKGLTNKEIGKALGISKHTVRNQIYSITQKLEVADRTEAASVAIKQGIISVSS
jgi:DNA-binding NarL/FixJ family response regulator